MLFPESLELSLPSNRSACSVLKSPCRFNPSDSTQAIDWESLAFSTPSPCLSREGLLSCLMAGVVLDHSSFNLIISLLKIRGLQLFFLWSSIPLPSPTFLAHLASALQALLLADQESSLIQPDWKSTILSPHLSPSFW